MTVLVDFNERTLDLDWFSEFVDLFGIDPRPLGAILSKFGKGLGKGKEEF
jgi:hypothetical protein